MKKLPWNRFCFLILLSLSGAIGMCYCINIPGDSLAYSNSIWSFLLWIVLLYLLRRITAGGRWEQVRQYLNPGFFFGWIFAGAMAAGRLLDNTGGINFADWRLYMAVTAVAVTAAPFLSWGLTKLTALESRKGNQQEPADRKKVFFLTWGILLLAYIPTFLASFPGFFTYDAEWTVYAVFTEKYSAHMPVVYELLLGWLLRLVFHLTGSYNAGIALYVAAQMLVLSSCFAYMLSFLRSAGVRRWICWLGTAFLALCPTVSMFVCCSTKEGYFAGGVVLFTTLLLEAAREKEQFWQSRRKKGCFFGAMLLILFFRKDGIYALIPFLICFAVIYRAYWKKWLITVMGAVLLFFAVTEGCMWTFHFKKGPLGEMLCVPMQQLARVHKYDRESFSDEDLEILYSLIPEVILDQYAPKLADDVKLNFLEDNFKADPGKYISLWFRTGVTHFGTYVNAFLMNTYGYWYPDTIPDGYRGKNAGDGETVYGDSSYFAFTTEDPGVRRHFLPVLENFYKRISLEIYQQRVPVISMLFSIGFWHWMYLSAAVALLVRKYRRQAFALLPMGLLYLIILLGPIVLVRYVLYLFFGAPLALALLVDAGAIAGED